MQEYEDFKEKQAQESIQRLGLSPVWDTASQAKAKVFEVDFDDLLEEARVAIERATEERRLSAELNTFPWDGGVHLGCKDEASKNHYWFSKYTEDDLNKVISTLESLGYKVEMTSSSGGRGSIWGKTTISW